MTRNEAREIMMQILYELDASKTIEKDKTDNLADARAKAAALASERLSGGHIKRGTDLICSILDNLKDIDSSINEFSAKWKTSRMPKVDLAIMRLAIGEIRFSEDIPEPVSVNEAINLAKKFSTDNSARFIHGILGAVTGK
ncbi:MAG: transcription antitermination factor NusB [Bacillota bacterium]|nr:transcription antitermination factor NusB [Clostridiales bacterium]MDO4471551.1 transcription antitermination factor NusB [Bacillota bacterium]